MKKNKLRKMLNKEFNKVRLEIKKNPELTDIYILHLKTYTNYIFDEYETTKKKNI